MNATESLADPNAGLGLPRLGWGRTTRRQGAISGARLQRMRQRHKPAARVVHRSWTMKKPGSNCKVNSRGSSIVGVVEIPEHSLSNRKMSVLVSGGISLWNYSICKYIRPLVHYEITACQGDRLLCGFRSTHGSLSGVLCVPSLLSDFNQRIIHCVRLLSGISRIADHSYQSNGFNPDARIAEKFPVLVGPYARPNSILKKYAYSIAGVFCVILGWLLIRAILPGQDTFIGALIVIALGIFFLFCGQRLIFKSLASAPAHSGLGPQGMKHDCRAKHTH